MGKHILRVGYQPEDSFKRSYKGKSSFGEVKSCSMLEACSLGGTGSSEATKEHNKLHSCSSAAQ